MALLGTSCANGTQAPLDLITLEPGDAQWQIASYHKRQAVRDRQRAEELRAQADRYEQLFGAGSDWVAGTRALARLYEDAASEQDRLADMHAGRAHSEPAPLRP